MNNVNQKCLMPFPPDISFETAKIYKSLTSASRALAELKGASNSPLNRNILTSTLFSQEVWASSGTVETKEFTRYPDALRLGYDALRQEPYISEDMLIVMFQELTQRSGNYRKTPVNIQCDHTGKVVYTPPQGEQQIAVYMRDLVAFINDHINGNWYDDIDPLIKVALIHHQFESIHPFPDGNGRTGQMLNVLYLAHTGLLDVPILYLSQTINRNKLEYYRLLQAVRNEGAWEDWIIYMLDSVTVAAKSTLKLVIDIRDLMQATKHRMRKELKFYSQDLLDYLFRYPCTRTNYVEQELGIPYSTAARNLKELTSAGFLTEKRCNERKYYVNQKLIKLFLNASMEDVSKIETYQ